MANVYIGLGSNIEQPIDQITRALSELSALPSSQLVEHSALYKTRPIGPQNQPGFVNAVARLKTSLSPLVLLGHLQIIERRHRRLRVQKWGRRTLDLDILLYSHVPFRHPRLTIPHPFMHKRGFVLIPLYELNPDLMIPGKGRVKALIKRIESGTVSFLT